MLQELIQYCRIKAIDGVLNPTEETYWKSITRAYSKRFSVPLGEVRKMDPGAVILEVYQDDYDEIDVFEHLEDFLEQIYAADDPNYSKQKEEDMEVFIKAAEKRETNRIKPKNPALEIKKSGSVDFSNLNTDQEH
ncbi:MAG TPA: hypothetical protein VN855_00465 [Candidatus Acidoferrum sp.]|nr:hypothetical protein [Candidatus Acidoferrum sp.]